MPRSKKRKTTHHPQQQQPNTNGQSLSHEEIWDDSALLRSWNDALAEYEFYHSIHAKGEDVDEVLKRAEMAGDGSDADEGEIVEDADGDEDLEVGRGVEAEVTVGGTTVKGVRVEHEGGSGGVALDSVVDNVDAPDPSTLGSEAVKSGLSVQDQQATISTATSDHLLENVKMAYYWAGYYSGLYDAQRQAQSQPQTRSSNG